MISTKAYRDVLFLLKEILKYIQQKYIVSSRFASVSEEEILSMNEEAVPKNTKMATTFSVTVFNGKLYKISSNSYSKAKKYNALFTKTVEH